MSGPCWHRVAGNRRAQPAGDDGLGLGDVPGTADIAEAVAFLASDRAAFITGEVLNVAGGSYMRT